MGIIKLQALIRSLSIAIASEQTVTMDHDDIVPVYLEKFKGGRVVFYRGGDSKNNNNTVSQVFVGLVFAILYSLYVSVIIADRVWEGQLSYAAIIFFFVLSRVLIFTYHLSRGVEGATDAICTCDHVQKHNDAWRDDVAKCDHGDGFIEAGTIVNWGIEYASGVQKLHCGDSLAGESDADKIVDDLLQVQWDCGYRKVYSRINGEWNLLRVFDMGPTGISLVSRFCQHNPLSFWIILCNIIKPHSKDISTIPRLLLKSLGDQVLTPQRAKM